MVNRITTSVCMATYNGEKYLKEQLVSILNQTLKPDEVILYDDGSSDDTVSIIRAFINENGLQDKWILLTNQQNRGYPGCYYYVMELCTQDIIFLADQDDIWDMEKLERMCRVFSQEAGVLAVACKFGLIDMDGNEIHTVMAPTKSKGTGGLRKVSVHDVFYKGEWPGMVIAYRRAWYSNWVQKYYDSLPHDLLVTVRAAEEEGFWQLDEELAWHRRHGKNAAKEEHRFRKLLQKDRKLQEIENYRKHLDVFSSDKILRTREGKNALEQKQKAMKARYEALLSGKRGQILRAALDNKENVRLATVVCDLMICRQKKES